MFCNQENIFLIILILILVYYFWNYLLNDKKLKEKFQNTQNWNMTNKNDIAQAMEFGEPTPSQILKKELPVMETSSVEDGYNQNSNNDNYTKDGYKWTKEDNNNYNINDVQTMMSDAELKNKFQNMYMLDPTGDLAKYDISNMPISKYCCPAVYRNPSGGMDDMDPVKACEYANKYVANGYSGMNFNDGLGCVCITPNDASFYASRGGNTSIS